MSIKDLLALLNNRLAFLASQRASAVQRGDVAVVSQTDAETAVTQATIDQLQSLL